MTTPVSFLRPLLMAATMTALGAATAAAAVDTSTAAFLKTHCLTCHEGPQAEGALDLATLGEDLNDPAVEKRWVRIFDRVREGEMPPQDADQPQASEVASFLQSVGDRLRTFHAERDAAIGRVHARRLTRREVERSLHSLLGVDIPLADQLPEDMRSAGFTTVADGQSMSHFQLERHLAVVDLALDEAFRRVLSPNDEYEQDFNAEDVARRNPRVRCREPEMRKGQAVTWSSGLIFYGRLPATTAPDDGWYRFTATVSALKPPKSGGVWTTVSTGLCVSSAPLLAHVTAFEATEKPKTIEFEAWLPRKHMIEIRPGDTTLAKARFQGGQVGVGEGEPQDVPGIAIDRLTMERIHHGPSNAELRKLLIGELRYETGSKKNPGKILSKSAKADVVKLVRAMAARAFRRPVTNEQAAPYVSIALASLDDGQDFAAALRAGYRAVLCSPRFLYLTETPGKLDAYALAARLSYFLTGGPPDAQLAASAASGKLLDPEVLQAQTDRLLAGQSGRRFVEDFAGQWLDLDLIDFTEPDRKLVPDFDAIVKHSMLNETHAFLEEMLRENQSVERLVRADYTYINSRLARFYKIDDVRGDDLERVRLKTDDHRGGLMTQGAIMKVTANGSTTSPVVRGVWVSERILGVPIPPPPTSVPAIEPDIRGATTIREQLAKHRSQESCAVCHRKIDPPGFALENFDPAGQWRERYPLLVAKKRSSGPKIDPSYTMADGRSFADVEEFKSLVASDPKTLAANVAEKLLTYGTGAPISFRDRDAVEQIVEQVAHDGYGLRSIVQAVVASPVFLNK